MLHVDAVSKAVEGRPLFAELSLQLVAGEFVALLGESGAGKSTLLNLIAGLEKPDAGVVRLDGRALSALDDDALARWRRRELGFVFQAFHVLPHLDLADNVALPLRLNGLGTAAARARAQAMLAEVGLPGRAGAWPRELSGGELQRVAIARALVHSPRLVLADEPTGNLDPGRAGQVLDLLRQQARARSAMLLMVTHSQQAARAADRALVLAGGGLQRWRSEA